jgi:hypothetical protein
MKLISGKPEMSREESQVSADLRKTKPISGKPEMGGEKGWLRFIAQPPAMIWRVRDAGLWGMAARMQASRPASSYPSLRRSASAILSALPGANSR